jgi:hypothetical protein
MDDFLTQEQFAEAWGKSKTAVQKARRDGRIPPELVKKQGRQVLIHRSALEVLKASTDPAAAAKNELSEPGELPLVGKDPHSYQLERAKREKFAALSAELDYNKAIGRVVEVDAMNEAQRRLFRDARDKLLNLADRLTPMITPDMDPARRHATIKRELEKVLNELSDDARAESSEGAAERLAA